MSELTKEYFDEQMGELSRMVADGFADMQSRLDVTDRVEKLEKEMGKLRKALHLNPSEV